METSVLLIGPVAVAAIVVKTIISFVRHYIFLNSKYTPLIALGLGVICGIIIDARLFGEIVYDNIFIKILENILGGIIIGATAMGVHETTKAVRDK